MYLSYPTLEQVNTATRLQICRWHRFLPSPGSCVTGESNFESVLTEQKVILDRIEERFAEFGGITPAISKELGWK